MRRIGEKRGLQQSSLSLDIPSEFPPPKKVCSVPDDVEVAFSSRLKGVFQGAFQSIYEMFGVVRSMLSWSSPPVTASQQQHPHQDHSPEVLYCKPSRPTAVTSTPCAGDPPFPSMSAEDDISLPAFLTTKHHQSKRYDRSVPTQDTVKTSPRRKVSKEDAVKTSPRRRVSTQDAVTTSPGRRVPTQDTVKTSPRRRISTQDTVKLSPGRRVSTQDTVRKSPAEQAASFCSAECKSGDSVDGAPMQSSMDYRHLTTAMSSSVEQRSSRTKHSFLDQRQPTTTCHSYHGYSNTLYSSKDRQHQSTLYSSVDHQHPRTLYSSTDCQHVRTLYSSKDRQHPRTLYCSEDHGHPRAPYSSLTLRQHKTLFSSGDETAGLSKNRYLVISPERPSISPCQHTIASGGTAAVVELHNSSQSSAPSEDSKTSHTVAAKYDSRSSSWREWMKNFKLDYKHSQEEQQVMMEAAKAKLKLHQQKRMEQEDKIVERLRKGLASAYVDSDEEDEDVSWHLSGQQQARVAMAISRGSEGECLSERYRIRVTRGDLRTLTGSTWLNDEVINFYFNLISECCKKEKGFRVHVFNSFFYAKLSQSGYGGVRRWTKKVNLFEQDLILLPVHLGMHWCLAAIDFRSREFTYYDSLLGRNPNCLARLREYLVSESMDKRKLQLDLSDWHDHTPQNIPRQENGSDCGVFTCMFARHKAWQLPFRFSQDDMQDIRQHMIYEILEQTLV